MEFRSDEKWFGSDLRSARRGVAGGPSEMTTEHVRPLLDEHRGTHLLFRLGENLAKAQVPRVAANIIGPKMITVLTRCSSIVFEFI